MDDYMKRNAKYFGTLVDKFLKGEALTDTELSIIVRRVGEAVYLAAKQLLERRRRDHGTSGFSDIENTSDFMTMVVGEVHDLQHERTLPKEEGGEG